MFQNKLQQLTQNLEVEVVNSLEVPKKYRVVLDNEIAGAYQVRSRIMPEHFTDLLDAEEWLEYFTHMGEPYSVMTQVFEGPRVMFTGVGAQPALILDGKHSTKISVVEEYYDKFLVGMLKCLNIIDEEEYPILGVRGTLHAAEITQDLHGDEGDFKLFLQLSATLITGS